MIRTASQPRVLLDTHHTQLQVGIVMIRTASQPQVLPATHHTQLQVGIVMIRTASQPQVLLDTHHTQLQVGIVMITAMRNTSLFHRATPRETLISYSQSTQATATVLRIIDDRFTFLSTDKKGRWNHCSVAS
jgi:hypothetical protein